MTPDWTNAADSNTLASLVTRDRVSAGVTKDGRSTARKAMRPGVEGVDMQLWEVAPRDWDARVVSPTVSRGFALAATASGYEVLYAADRAARALVLVKTLPLPLLRSWTARAKVFVSRADTPFVSALVSALTARGIVSVTIEDTIGGLSRPLLEHAGVTTRLVHRLVHPPAQSDRELYQRLTRHRRTALRRARHDGIVVTEIRNKPDVLQYCRFAAHDLHPGAGGDADEEPLPAAFFAAVLGAMVPREQAVFFLARRGERPISGALFLTSPGRMTLFHAASRPEPELAVSAWDPDFADWPGPTAVIWHALRTARERGIPRVDLGIVAPLAEPDDPRFPVDRFKQSFGGTLEAEHRGEATLSRLKHALHRRFQRLPAWMRVAEDVYASPRDVRRPWPREGGSRAEPPGGSARPPRAIMGHGEQPRATAESEARRAR